MIMYTCIILLIFFVFYFFSNFYLLIVFILSTFVITRWLFFKLLRESTLWNSDIFFKCFDNLSKLKLFIARNVEDYFNPPNKTGKLTSIPSNKVITEDMQSLFNEICTCIHFIVRDFLHSWYDSISSDDKIPEEFRDFLENIFISLYSRFQQISIQDGAVQVLVKYREHFVNYKGALLEANKIKLHQGQLCEQYSIQPVIQESYQHFTAYHLAVHSREKEIQYLRTVIKMLIEILISKDIYHCTPYQSLMIELLTSNVFLPVIDMLCEPDWLNEKIILLLSNEKIIRKEKIKTESLPINTSETLTQNENNGKDSKEEKQPSSCSLIKPERYSKIEAFTSDEVAQHFSLCQKRKSEPHEQIIEADCPSNNLYNESNKLIRRHSSYLERSQGGNKKLERNFHKLRESNRKSQSYLNLTDVGNLSEFGNSNGDSYRNETELQKKDVQSDQSKSVCVNMHSEEKYISNYERSIPFQISKPDCLNVDVSQSFSKDRCSNYQHSDTQSPDVAQEALENTFNFSMTAAKLFENIRITKTETVKEHRSNHQYTMYIIEYDAWYKTVVHTVGSEDTEIGGYFLQPSSVKRRFREFLNLQNRLEDNHSLKKNLKGVKGLSKWLTLPFGNMYQSNVEQRRKLLESFLQALCKISDLNVSSEVREFLAYGSDARIAFVKKAPELPVPRIDKFVARTVSGVFDKIKTALPSLPQEKHHSKENGCHREDSNSPIMDTFEDRDTFHLNFGYHNEKPLSLLLSTMGQSRDTESEIEPAEEACSESPSEKSESSATSLPMGPRSQGDGCDVMELGSEHSNVNKAAGMDHDIPFASIVLELGVEIIRCHQSWLSLDKTVHVFKMIFGKIMERWLCWHIHKLLSPAAWVGYIRLLQDTVWPNGILGIKRRIDKSRSEKEMTKQQALKVLQNFFPGVFKKLLGHEPYMDSLKLILDLFQHPQLNRHLIYTMLDLFFELLIPEIHFEEFRQQIAGQNHQKIITPTSPYKPVTSIFNRSLV